MRILNFVNSNERGGVVKCFLFTDWETLDLYSYLRRHHSDAIHEMRQGALTEAPIHPESQDLTTYEHEPIYELIGERVHKLVEELFAKMVTQECTLDPFFHDLFQSALENIDYRCVGKAIYFDVDHPEEPPILEVL